MLSELSQLIPVGGAIKNIAAALVQERDREKIAALKIDLTDKILELQTKLLEVQSAVVLEREALRAAHERIRDLESDQREKARYELAKLGTLGDFFAYRLRPQAELSDRASEPTHFLCQTCFDSSKKSVLVHNGEGYWECLLCKTGRQTSEPNYVEAPSPLNSYIV
ncbi:hypothetical protein [Delftia acidovorans]|uniref:hypothetical protein n=1 Tax=Delftia acidovorans TaxID=80866 RepID=UPI001ED95B4F|nr:hypothetical protein [Delftia acidovorans]